MQQTWEVVLEFRHFTIHYSHERWVINLLKLLNDELKRQLFGARIVTNDAVIEWVGGAVSMPRGETHCIRGRRLDLTDQSLKYTIEPVGVHQILRDES